MNLVHKNKTPLGFAAENGDKKLVEFLLEEGADVNITNKNPEAEPPILAAVRAGSRKALEVLVKAGADVNVQCSSPHPYGVTTPLLQTIICGKAKCLSVLIDAGAEVNFRGGERPPLHKAAQYGDIKCLKVLLQAGVDLNDRDNSGRTPVLTATGFAKRKCLNLLLELGADVNISDEVGLTLLIYAAAVGLGSGVVLSLVKAGADVNAVSSMGGTYKSPLFSATFSKDLQSVRLLLRNGAKINIRDDRGRNSLTLSFRHKGRKSQTLQKLLHAAGETLDPTIVPEAAENDITEYFQDLTKNLNFKHLCREAIREHLVDLDPHEHLFGRIPQLELPSVLTEYLLYNCSLDS